MKKKKKSTGTPWIDPDDAPELTQEWFDAADLYVGDKLIRRGRPRKPVRKQMIAFRLPPDLIALIKAKGRGYSARVEKALRDAAAKGLL